MSKKQVTSDQPYAYINKQGKGEAAVTYQQLTKLVQADVLDDDDKIRRHSESEWKRVADADWLLYLSDQTPDTAPSYMDSTPSPVAGKSGQRPKKKSKRGLLLGFGSIVVVGLGIMIWFMIGSSGFGSSPEDSAANYVEGELTAWRAGRDTDLCGVIQPILVEYDIVDIQHSMQRNRTLNIDAVGVTIDTVDVTVQLTFSTLVGGRPVELHTFTVQRLSVDGDWEMVPLTKYMARP